MNQYSSEQVAALSAIYQADETANTGASAYILQMMAAGVAFMVGTLAFSSTFGNQIPWWIVALFPTAPIIIIAYQALMANAVRVRAISQRIVEHRLVEAAGLPNEAHRFLGGAPAEKIMDIEYQTLAQKAATLIAYGGIQLAVIAYTLGIVVVATYYSLHWFGILYFVPYISAGYMIGMAWWQGDQMVGSHKSAARTAGLLESL